MGEEITDLGRRYLGQFDEQRVAFRLWGTKNV